MKSVRIFAGAICAVLVIAGIVLFRGDLQHAFRAAQNIARAFADRSFSYQSFVALQVEQRGLLAALRARNVDAPELNDGSSFRSVQVFSRYPLNDQQFLIINAGSDDGVAAGMPVFASEHVLIGKVARVRRTQSEVETVLNPGWRSAVALGSLRTEAVLRGGSPPRLEFVPADAVLEDGDQVVSISSEFPLNAFLGTVSDISVDAKTLWQSGTVSVPYGNVDRLDQVLLLLRFP